MPRKLRTVPDIYKDAQAYINKRIASLKYSSTFESSKKPVRTFLEKYGVEDDDGNLVYRFPHPVTGVDNKPYVGVILKRSAGQPFVDETEVSALLTEINPKLLARVFKTVEVMDSDELYVLQQEGVITEEQLRSLLHYPKPKYTLWPLEPKQSLEEDDDDTSVSPV